MFIPNTECKYDLVSPLVPARRGDVGVPAVDQSQRVLRTHPRLVMTKAFIDCFGWLFQRLLYDEIAISESIWRKFAYGT